MIKKIKNILTMFVLTSSLVTPAAIVGVGGTVALAACSGTASSISKGVDETADGGTKDADCASSNVSDSSVGKIGKEVVTVFSEIVGVVSIIMIVYGGFRYITSGGDSGKVGSAKTTIIYAIVGLVIVALAQAIVHYVLNTSSTVTTPTAPAAG